MAVVFAERYRDSNISFCYPSKWRVIATPASRQYVIRRDKRFSILLDLLDPVFAESLAAGWKNVAMPADRTATFYERLKIGGHTVTAREIITFDSERRPIGKGWECCFSTQAYIAVINIVSSEQFDVNQYAPFVESIEVAA